MEDSPNRRFFVQFLNKCVGGESVVSIDGKEQENPLMSREEADLRLALFDQKIEPTLEIELELAQYEAMRWPKSKKVQGRVWELMEKIKNQI
mgnify:CR=1 FL=1|tara:strand:- start:2087 stop:2362 length:276 start_codon:yes stop_codon:yes gene_type:complete